jgi:two-component system phosphate regulon sensor histidine kinase PhoR
MRPRNISLLVSFLVSIVTFFFGLILIDSWKLSAYISLAVFASSFFLYLTAIESYIARRISLVYKLISNLKIDRGLKEALGHKVGDDPITGIEKEVSDWANSKTIEIETLKKNAQYRKEFLGNLSHELRTPLFNIQGYVHSLLNGGMEEKSLADNFLHKAEKNIDRLVALVEDADVMSKLDTGEIPLALSVFDLTALIKDIAETLDENAAERGIRIQIPSDDKKMVEADREKIAQVISNLIDNSIKYGRQGGHIKVKIYEMGEQYLTEITDDGAGIAEEHIPRLFERFYRVDRSRKSMGGSGIGLAIVKHIINAHKQTINVRSTVGVGTTFAFTLQKK